MLPGYAIPTGTAFLLIVNDGTDPVVGTFAGLPEGAVFEAGGQFFSISYQAGSGNNDIVVTRVNPPAPPAQFPSISQLAPSTIELQGYGGSNGSYIMQANTNLATTNWTDLATVFSDALGRFGFIDTNVSQAPIRFFRARNP